MCMWQSAAFGGAFNLGDSVPVELGTCWASADGMARPEAAAVTASSEAPLRKSRRTIMSSSRFWRSLGALIGITIGQRQGGRTRARYRALLSALWWPAAPV